MTDIVERLRENADLDAAEHVPSGAEVAALKGGRMNVEIFDNARVMIKREGNRTEVWFARMPGCFGGHPNMIFARRITNDEVNNLLYDPWQVFDKPASPYLRQEEP